MSASITRLHRRNRNRQAILAGAMSLGLALGALLVSAPAASASNPLIVITETGGSTNVYPDGPLTDSYTIQLTQAPIDDVVFVISTSTGGLPVFAEISIDDGTSWSNQAALVIPTGNTDPHTVMVRWADNSLTVDDIPPTARTMTIMHPASSWDDLDYDFTNGRNVYVGIEASVPDEEGGDEEGGDEDQGEEETPGGEDTDPTPPPAPPARVETARA